MRRFLVNNNNSSHHALRQSITQQPACATNAIFTTTTTVTTPRAFSTTSHNRGLEEFVDHTLFEGKKLETSGRAWKAKELRRKSLLDLQRLWFVLYKERNMLMTMDRLSKMMDGRLFHKERVHKVAQSMARIKTIVRERQLQAKKMAEIEFAQNKAKGLYKWPPESSEMARLVLENNQELAEQLRHEESEVSEQQQQ